MVFFLHPVRGSIRSFRCPGSSAADVSQGVASAMQSKPITSHLRTSNCRGCWEPERKNFLHVRPARAKQPRKGSLSSSPLFLVPGCLPLLLLSFPVHCEQGGHWTAFSRVSTRTFLKLITQQSMHPCASFARFLDPFTLSVSLSNHCIVLQTFLGPHCLPCDVACTACPTHTPLLRGSQIHPDANIDGRTATKLRSRHRAGLGCHSILTIVLLNFRREKFVRFATSDQIDIGHPRQVGIAVQRH